MSDLPKPFRAQKVTNGNANEVITNFLIKSGYTIPYVESDIINMIQNKKSFNGKPLKKYPIIYVYMKKIIKLHLLIIHYLNT